MKNLCVIPARLGSKRIPNKNIKNFYDRPIISWSIQLAIESQLFENIIVSTDSQEITDISISNGAEVPFLRPAELSDDYTTSLDVIRHAIENFEKTFYLPDFVCCLYPTTPLLRVQDLTKSFEMLKAHDDKSLFCMAVAEFPSEIQRALTVGIDLKLNQIDKKQEFVRSQDLEKHFYDAGQFYWGHSKDWLKKNSIRESSLAYVLPKWTAVDINSESDWEQAEVLFELLRKSEGK